MTEGAENEWPLLAPYSTAGPAHVTTPGAACPAAARTHRGVSTLHGPQVEVLDWTVTLSLRLSLDTLSFHVRIELSSISSYE